MQNQNKVFEDLSKVATSALGTLAGMGREVEEQARRRAREFVAGDEAISRDEFEAVKANAAAAREAVETLKADVAALKAALEAVIGAGPKAAASAAPKDAAAAPKDAASGRKAKPAA